MASTTTLQGTATSAPYRPARWGLWRTVMGCEWRLLHRDVGAWLALVLVLSCTVAALLNGQQRLAERSAIVAAAQADERQRLQTLATQLARTAQAAQAGTAAAPVEAWRDPGNPVSVGRGIGAPIVHLADAPLGVAAIGLSDLYPATFRVAVGSRDRFLFAEEIANPLHLATGSFDLVFVTVYLLPLVLLALSYNVLSGEREQGTWALTLSSSAPPLAILLAKLVVRNAGVVAVLLLGSAAGWLLQGGPSLTAEAALAFAAWSALVVLYSAFWVLLALWVNSWQRDSAFNALALVMAWVLLLLVVPAVVNATAQALHPAPARAEMVLAVRQAAVDADRDRAAEQARFAAEHGGAAPANDRERRTLALTLLADQRADEVLARHEAQVRRQRSLTDRLGLLSPPLVVNAALVNLAGNGHARWDAYLQAVDSFHDRWQAHFVGMAQRGARVQAADLSDFPRYTVARQGTWAPGMTASLAVACGLLALCTLLLGVLASQKLRGAH